MNKFKIEDILDENDEMEVSEWRKDLYEKNIQEHEFSDEDGEGR